MTFGPGARSEGQAENLSRHIVRGPVTKPPSTRRYVAGDDVTAGVGMGFNKDGLERFGAVAASHVGEDKVPGLVALVASGDDVHVEALGTLAVGGRPVERAVAGGSIGGMCP